MLKAPYNFVGLNRDVFIPSWAEQVSHDVPFSDGEDGLIEVELVNRTPLVVRNGIGASASDKDKKEVWPSHIVKADGTKAYFLPGSSIKGMLRAVLEILSFGRLDENAYNDELFAYRDFGKDSPLTKPYVEAMAKVGYGWLHYDMKTDRYLLDDCGDFSKANCTIAISELKRILPKYEGASNDDAFKKADKLGYPKINGRTLVCSGHMNGKLVEYLFGDVQNSDVVVDEEVINRMKTVYKPSKDYYDPLCSKLRNGERFPVFFRRSADGGILEMGLTRMFRHAYKYRMSDCVKQEDKAGHDLAQCIFGYTEKLSSLKGRVSIGNAFCTETVNDGMLEKLSGVLGQPRASYHPLYLNQSNRIGGKYFTYDDARAEMAGRKRYRIHTDHVLTDIPQGNKNEKLTAEMHMLPAGLHFRFKMSLHNMRHVEVGALLSALTFHGTKGVFHNIGMAKSFGYGKLEIQKVTLKGFTQEMNDYMREFELCMTEFTKASSKPMLWTATPQVQMLLAIASEHSDKDELTMMKLQEYKKGKENNDYNELKEHLFCPKTLVGSSDKVKLESKNEVARLENRLTGLKPLEECSSAECIAATGLIADVVKEFEKLQGPQGKVFQSRIDELQKLKTVYNDAVLKKSASNVPTAAAESFEKQLPKISSSGQLKGALQKWLKGKDRSAFTEDECQWLHDRLVDFWQDKAFKKERKKWQELGKGVWKDLAEFIHSDELLDGWYEECATH